MLVAHTTIVLLVRVLSIAGLQLIADSSFFLTEPYVYVDYNVLNDRITSSAQMQRQHDFRGDVIERDGPFCIIMGEAAEYCDNVVLLEEALRGVDVDFV
jgi:hypothetical protein